MIKNFSSIAIKPRLLPRLVSVLQAEETSHCVFLRLTKQVSIVLRTQTKKPN